MKISDSILVDQAASQFLERFSNLLAQLLHTLQASLLAQSERGLEAGTQRCYQDAYGLLLHEPQVLSQKLQEVLLGLLKRSMQTAYAADKPSFFDILARTDLSLIDADTLAHELYTEAVCKRFRDAAGGSLSELNQRMANLFGQDYACERENPFRPYLLVRTTLDAVAGLPLAAATSRVLGEEFCQVLEGQLADLYGGLNVWLENQGVVANLNSKKTPLKRPRPAVSPEHRSDDALADAAAKQLNANYRIDQLFDAVNQHTSVSHAADTAFPQAEFEARRHDWMGEEQGVANCLSRLFGDENMLADKLARAGSPPSTLLQAIGGLVHKHIPDADEMLDMHGAVRNLVRELRYQLARGVQNPHEQMVIDVVALLFDLILQDEQIPAEVRAQLGRLQLLVLKVALSDPALFAHEQHPARRLVNRMGTVCAGMDLACAHSQAVIKQIRDIVDILLAEDQDQLACFAAMLSQFDQFVEHAWPQLDQASKLAQQVERSTEEIARLRAALHGSIKDLELPAPLRKFLLETWPQVLEQAQRQSPSRLSDMQAIVPELVWSVHPQHKLSERSLLLQRVPIVVQVLKEGLVMIAWPSEQSTAWFSWLQQVHTQVLRCLVMDENTPPLQVFREGIANSLGLVHETVGQSMSLQDSDILNRQLYAQAMRGMEVDFSYYAPPMLLDSGLLNPEGDPHDEALQRLQNGVWVELELDGQMQSACLSWRSNNASQLILSREHSPPVIIGSRLLLLLIKQGRARFLEDSPLFERAIMSLLRYAKQVDLTRQV